MLFLDGVIESKYQNAVESYLRRNAAGSYICRIQEEIVPVRVFKQRPEAMSNDDEAMPASSY